MSPTTTNSFPKPCVKTHFYSLLVSSAFSPFGRADLTIPTASQPARRSSTTPSQAASLSKQQSRPAHGFGDLGLALRKLLTSRIVSFHGCFSKTHEHTTPPPQTACVLIKQSRPAHGFGDIGLALRKLHAFWTVPFPRDFWLPRGAGGVLEQAVGGLSGHGSETAGRGERDPEPERTGLAGARTRLAKGFTRAQNAEADDVRQSRPAHGFGAREV